MLRNTKLLIIVSVTIATVGLMWWDNTHITPVSAQPPPDGVQKMLMPDVAFMRLNGDEIPLHSLKGKPVWLHFWASWCTPCRTEFRSLLEHVAQHPDAPILLAVSADENIAEAEKFIAPYRKNFSELFAREQVIIAIDSSRNIIEGMFQTFQFPETILIDANGFMQRKIIGPMEFNDGADADRRGR